MTNKQINARVMKIQNALLDLARDVENERDGLKAKAQNIQERNGKYWLPLTDKQAKKADSLLKRADILSGFAETLYIDFEDNLLEEESEGDKEN